MTESKLLSTFQPETLNYLVNTTDENSLVLVQFKNKLARTSNFEILESLLVVELQQLLTELDSIFKLSSRTKGYRVQLWIQRYRSIQLTLPYLTAPYTHLVLKSFTTQLDSKAMKLGCLLYEFPLLKNTKEVEGFTLLSFNSAYKMLKSKDPTELVKGLVDIYALPTKLHAQLLASQLPLLLSLPVLDSSLNVQFHVLKLTLKLIKALPVSEKVEIVALLELVRLGLSRPQLYLVTLQLLICALRRVRNFTLKPILFSVLPLLESQDPVVLITTLELIEVGDLVQLKQNLFINALLTCLSRFSSGVKEYQRIPFTKAVCWHLVLKLLLTNGYTDLDVVPLTNVLNCMFFQATLDPTFISLSVQVLHTLSKFDLKVELSEASRASLLTLLETEPNNKCETVQVLIASGSSIEKVQEALEKHFNLIELIQLVQALTSTENQPDPTFKVLVDKELNLKLSRINQKIFIEEVLVLDYSTLKELNLWLTSYIQNQNLDELQNMEKWELINKVLGSYIRDSSWVDSLLS